MLTRNQLGFTNNESSQKKVVSHEKEVSSWTQVRHFTLARGEAGDDGGCRQLGELPLEGPFLVGAGSSRLRLRCQWGLERGGQREDEMNLG